MSIDQTAGDDWLPFARLDIKANALGIAERTYVHVVVDGKPVAQIPVTNIGLDYTHNKQAIVSIGLFRADIDFKGIEGA